MEEDINRTKALVSPTEWLSHYNAWKEDAISKTEYCRRHGLITDNFYYWCRRFDKETGSAQKDAFIPIVTQEALSTMNEKTVIEISLPNDIRMKVALYPKMLSTLIQELNDAATVIR